MFQKMCGQKIILCHFMKSFENFFICKRLISSNTPWCFGIWLFGIVVRAHVYWVEGRGFRARWFMFLDVLICPPSSSLVPEGKLGESEARKRPGHLTSKCHGEGWYLSNKIHVRLVSGKWLHLGFT